MTVTQVVPGRYGSARDWSERFAKPMFALAGPNARMRGEELDDLVNGLMQRDQLADDLVRAVREEHAVTMPQVRAAMAGELSQDAHPALRAFFDRVEHRPDWVDEELLERGGAAARRIGKDGFDILAFGSLLGGYRSGAALQPLVRTGRFDDTLNRVGETGQWWLACTAPGGMARDGEGWRLSVHVRVMHAFVNYQLEHDPDWDWDFRGVPVND